jgi:hypothetical protein
MKDNKKPKQPCLFNNEEWRFFDGKKVLGKTNAKAARRDWCPEGE